MHIYFIIFIAAIMSAIVPIIIKLYISNGEKDKILIILAIIIGIMTIFIYIELCKRYGATRMYTIVKISAIVLVAITGYLYLGENMKTRHFVGIFLALIALVLLNGN